MEAYVTLVSIQPDISTMTIVRVPRQNHPQAQARMHSGVYAARRKRRIYRPKKA
jgi:hypothetical protein